MTNGYACVCDKSKVKSVAYLQSDAYLSGYGKEILSSIMEGKINEWFDDQIDYNHELYGKEEPNKFFELSWIRKNKEFPEGQSEYGYLYEQNSGILKVYYYGSLIYEVGKDERDKYLYFFKNEVNIWKAATYNAAQFSFGNTDREKTIEKEFRNLIRESTIDDLKVLNEKGKADFIVLSDYHLIGPGYSNKYPVYQKILHWEVSGYSVQFHVGKSPQTRKWDVDIQLPFIRVTIGEDYRTEAAAVTAIKSMVSQSPESFERFAEIASAYEKVKYADTGTINRFINHVQSEWDKSPWFQARGFFTPERIEKALRRSMVYFACNA